MGKTGVPYADTAWNPLVGCSAASPGCRNCYAARLAATRLRHLPDYKGLAATQHEGLGPSEWTGKVRLLPKRLSEPLHTSKSRRRVVFVSDMGDLFHEAVPFEFLAAVYGVMAATPWNTYLTLTKRPERRLEFFSWLAKRSHDELSIRTVCYGAACRAGLDMSRHQNNRVGTWPLENVKEGTTIEDWPRVERLEYLVREPNNWLSLEPLLGRIDLGLVGTIPKDWGLGYVALRDLIQWIVVGGETGRKARDTDLDCMADIALQAKAADVPLYVKQLGSSPRLSGKPYLGEPPLGLDIRNEPFRTASIEVRHA